MPGFTVSDDLKSVTRLVGSSYRLIGGNDAFPLCASALLPMLYSLLLGEVITTGNGFLALKLSVLSRSLSNLLHEYRSDCHRLQSTPVGGQTGSCITILNGTVPLVYSEGQERNVFNSKQNR